MPHVSFASNLLCVMVIGLLGPSVPAIVHDLGISYAQAGFLFTLLSLASLFGSSMGAIASDYMNRKRILASFCGLFAGGLICMGFVPGVTVFVVSLFGSPIGAIGQSVMLDMYPASGANSCPFRRSSQRSVASSHPCWLRSTALEACPGDGRSWRRLLSYCC